MKIIRDIIRDADLVSTIAGAIYLDNVKNDEIDQAINTYYATFCSIRDSKSRCSDTILYLNLEYNSKCEIEECDVGGVLGKELNYNEHSTYAIERYDLKRFSGIYVTNFLISMLGEKYIAINVLCERGWWPSCDELDVPDNKREEIRQMIILLNEKKELLLDGIHSGDIIEQYDYCRSEYKRFMKRKSKHSNSLKADREKKRLH